MKYQPLLLIAFPAFPIANVRSQGTYQFQPDIQSGTVAYLHENGFRFKDPNKNQKLDPYENYR